MTWTQVDEEKLLDMRKPLSKNICVLLVVKSNKNDEIYGCLDAKEDRDQMVLMGKGIERRDQPVEHGNDADCHYLMPFAPST